MRTNAVPNDSARSIISEEEIQEWVCLAVSGDENAFGRISEYYYETTLKMAYRMCGHVEDAQDITQDVMIRLGKSIRSF